MSTVPAHGNAIPTLSKICIGVLIRYRHLLSDVGYLEPRSVRAILSHCTPEELINIEDGTLLGSSRDLSWYTWDYWYRFYEQKFGVYKPGKVNLKPLPGASPPPDYEAPTGISAPTADWRGMLERDLELEKAKAAAVSDRLRSMYDRADKERASRSVEVCAILPPAKRARHIGPGARPPPVSGPEKAKMQMLHDIGLAKRSPSTSVTTTTIVTNNGNSSRSSSHNITTATTAKQVGRVHKVTVTKTTTVYKSAAPLASSPAKRKGDAGSGLAKLAAAKAQLPQQLLSNRQSQANHASRVASDDNDWPFQTKQTLKPASSSLSNNSQASTRTNHSTSSLPSRQGNMPSSGNSTKPQTAGSKIPSKEASMRAAVMGPLAMFKGK